MNPASLALLISAAAYTGFQWTIRSVVYPQFAKVPSEAFTDYERTHQHLLVRTVGPLFAALVVTAVVVIPLAADSVPTWLRLVPLLLVGALLGLTAFAAVPLHRTLSTGFDAPTHRQLLRVDSLRLVAALVLTAVAVLIVLK